MLQARGCPWGEWPELAALEHPDWLEDIHRAYVEAGPRSCAPTPSAPTGRSSRTGRTVEEVVPPSVASPAGRPGEGLVALDMGPTGQLLEPTGTLRFEEAVDFFAQMVRAGVQAGADLILIETMTDLQEARAALLAGKENSSLPVMVTMTYEERGPHLPGLRPGLCGPDPGGDGGRCHRSELLPGPREMPPLVEELTRWSTLPIAIKPNAGLPDPGGAGYDITAEEFAGSMAELTGLGVKLYGGCCGTTPEYIALLREELAGRTIVQVPRQVPAAVCSGTQAPCPSTGCGSSGSGSTPPAKEADEGGPAPGGCGLYAEPGPGPDGGGGRHPGCERGSARDRRGGDDGAHGEGPPGGSPTPPSSWTPPTLGCWRGALRVYCGKAIVNSVNGDEETLNAILPLVKKYGAAVVGLTLDHTGIPKTVDAWLIGGPPYPGPGPVLWHPAGGCVHRLPDPHRLR